MINDLDKFPMFLTVQDIAQITGLCLGKSYELCRSDGFPAIILGRRIVVPKAAFEIWMENPKAGVR